MKKISLAVMTVFSLNFYSESALGPYRIDYTDTPLNDSDMFCDST